MSHAQSALFFCLTSPARATRTSNPTFSLFPSHGDDHCDEPRHGATLGQLAESNLPTVFMLCDICSKTKITRVLCRKRAGTAIPRAESFGDLIAADHKVLSEGCESRNNHRYAVVVQDLATQWIQTYPCKTKTSQESQKSFEKFLEPTRKPKTFTLKIP